jgi:hypothetical protein
MNDMTKAFYSGQKEPVFFVFRSGGVMQEFHQMSAIFSTKKMMKVRKRRHFFADFIFPESTSCMLCNYTYLFSVIRVVIFKLK